MPRTDFVQRRANRHTMSIAMGTIKASTTRNILSATLIILCGMFIVGPRGPGLVIDQSSLMPEGLMGLGLSAVSLWLIYLYTVGKEEPASKGELLRVILLIVL